MSIEKMKLLSITGKEENIDDFIIKYLIDSGLQTENAIKVFEKGWKLTNFKYDSTSKDLQNKCKNIFLKYNIKYIEYSESDEKKNSLQEIDEKLESIKSKFEDIENSIIEKNQKIKELNSQVELLENLKNINIDISNLYNLRYIKFRYGKISKENYKKLEREIKDLNAIILNVGEDDENEWIICLTTKEYGAKVDSYLNVYKFERIWIPEELIGKPSENLIVCKEQIKKLEEEVEMNQRSICDTKNQYSNYLQEIYSELNLYIKIDTIKKFMAHDENGLFYIVGWIPVNELKQILPALSKEKDLKFVIKNYDEVASIPPTSLKNNRIFKPFETLVKMYGLPNYRELDPTAFVAITAFLLFGFMFGDLGHGFIIFIIGIIMSKKKAILGPVFEAGGIASMIFGVLYGSVFGKENILPAIFIRPMENIQTMLIYGIAIGVILIIISMILNIKNGIKNKDKKKIFFDTNGLAGLVFYILILVCAIYYLLKGKMIISFGILAIMLIIPLITIMFKDSLSEKVFKEKSKEKSSLVEKIFEIIEILLSFASNTISFVRIAAFAINHVGLCMAVYILSNMASGAGNIIIVIFGNAIVVVLEGLIVAIQVLRLEYYELFSRFYTGDGKEYKPLKEKI